MPLIRWKLEITSDYGRSGSDVEHEYWKTTLQAQREEIFFRVSAFGVEQKQAYEEIKNTKGDNK